MIMNGQSADFQARSKGAVIVIINLCYFTAEIASIG